MSTAVLPDERRELIMISFESTSSFFCSSPCTLVSPAKPTLFVRYNDPFMGLRGRDEQIDQARLAHVGGNELGSKSDGIEKESQIARGGSTQTNLLGEDVARQNMENSQDGRREEIAIRLETHLVSVMISVLGGCCSMDMAAMVVVGMKRQ